MGENSKISWCDHTFNPWMGCTKVSQGCKHCYAETLMDHRYGKVKWGPAGTRVRTSAANWRKPLQWNRQAEKEGRRYKVSCASLADVFEDRAELVPWRVDLLKLIGQTPHLDWLLLTKRPENVLSMITDAGELLLVTGHRADGVKILRWMKHGYEYAPANVWIGTSVEDQQQAINRIPALLSISAAVRFLSCEPLLGPVDLWPYTIPHFAADDPRHYPHRDGVEWVIAGAESGKGARWMDLDWVRKIRDQCAVQCIPFFFKQMIADGKKVELPDLDGQQWAQFPAVRHGA